MADSDNNDNPVHERAPRNWLDDQNFEGVRFIDPGGTVHTGSFATGSGLDGGDDITITGTWTWADDTPIVIGETDVFEVLSDDAGDRLLIRDSAGNLLVTVGTDGDVALSNGGLTVDGDIDAGSDGTLTIGTIENDQHVAVDIDTDDDHTSRTFTVTHDGGTETLLRVRENGTVSAEQGDLETTGNVTVGGTVDGVDVSAHADDASAHHAKTTTASEISDVSPDSDADAHHAKTTTASELTDVSADSVSDAHHARFTETEAVDAVQAEDPLTLTNELRIERSDSNTFINMQEIDTVGDIPILWTRSDDTVATRLYHDVDSDFFIIQHNDTFSLNITPSNNVNIPNGELRVGGGTIASGVVSSGSVQLTGGEATFTTGVSTSETATFHIAIGPATADAEIAASIEAGGIGEYVVHLDEINTDVGNPDVEIDVIRVR